MAITNQEESLTEKNGLGKELSLYNIFSVFLENEVLSSSEIDITHIPIEYIKYLANLYHCIDNSGDLILVTMLFVEYYHKEKTGQFKVRLSETKYKQLGTQFSLYCQLELIKRSGEITNLQTIQLFNPNIKTKMIIDPIVNKIKPIINKLKRLDVVIN